MQSIDYQHIVNLANYIDNTWQAKGKEKPLIIKDKYSQKTIAELPLATPQQLETAIQAAEKGFHIYRRFSAGKRAELLEKLKNELLNEKEAFIHLIVAEAGKPLDYAEMEVNRGIATLEAAIRATYTLRGDIIPIDFGIGERKTALTKLFPIGPIVCITPFNFPLNLALHKVAPALAVGCSFILKPPPQAPLTALALAKLCEKAGFPAGVVNVLACDIPEAEQLIKDERIKMLSFTGSAKVGWHLKNLAGKKKVALELGGNAAVIIDETVDLQDVAGIVAKGAQLYAGQICISTQRIITLNSVYEEFKQYLKTETEKLLVGNPIHKDCVVGPLIDNVNLVRVNDWVQEALNEGAEPICGAQVFDNDHNIYSPTLLENVNDKMKVVNEEVFGPVAVLEKVKTFEEAIIKANTAKYGLQAGIFTNRIDRMKFAHQELEVGGIIINHIPGFRMDNMPYGGIKDSGLGREGVWYAMQEMSEMRLLIY
jgi:glyceraldehyde-3-phosphate dehydrogenase (NADP+)